MRNKMYRWQYETNVSASLLCRLEFQTFILRCKITVLRKHLKIPNNLFNADPRVGGGPISAPAQGSKPKWPLQDEKLCLSSHDKHFVYREIRPRPRAIYLMNYI